MTLDLTKIGVQQQVLCGMRKGSAKVNDVQFEGSLDNDNSDVLLSQTSTQTQRKAPISFDLLRKRGYGVVCHWEKQSVCSRICSQFVP